MFGASFFGPSYLGGAYWGKGVSTPAPVVVTTTPDTIGRKRKKVRGPYSDPRIYEAYIERCIAERQAPRENVEAAVLKEALIDAVQARAQIDELEAITNENAVLHRLISMEKVKRNVASITARQRQIAARIEELEEDEARAVITLLDAM